MKYKIIKISGKHGGYDIEDNDIIELVPIEGEKKENIVKEDPTQINLMIIIHKQQTEIAS